MKNLILNFVLALFFLPILLIINTIKSSKSAGKKILFIILILIFFVSVFYSTAQKIIQIITFTSFETGLSDELKQVPVRGTSMMPTIKDGSTVELKNPNKYGLTRGDIVTFENKQTEGSSYIKRIVGLPGELLVIKNGNVFINGKALDEDYTLNHLPTFGNTSLVDCESNQIPNDHYAVLGDNRTVSSDSRVLGFIERDSIDGVIKTGLQDKFLNSEKQFNLTDINIQAEKFLELLNNKRKEASNSALTTHATLNEIAKKRATQITEKFDDWKNQTIPVDKLLDETKYRTNQTHEYVTFGYLDEQSILDQIFDSETQKNQFMSNQFTEVGIGISEKTNKECRFPVISIILSWPAIPTYDQKVIDSWAREIAINKQSLPNLQSWVGTGQVDETKLKREIALAAQMQQIATRIYNKEKNKEWLTAQDYQDIKLYDQLVQESNALDNELFGKFKKVQGIATHPLIPRRF